jgi:hypothetical protein
MSLAVAIAAPRSVERARSCTLTLTITDTLTGSVQIPSAATVAIYDSSTVILAATAATTLGAGGYSCTYALSAATIPDSIRLTDQWLEVWVLTLGGVEYAFRITGYLCRHAYHPTLTDADLIRLHPDLASQRPPGLTTYGGLIDEAQGWLERKLLQKGRRPELIFDAWALRDAHLYYTLNLIFRAFASSLGKGRYAEEATRYEAMAMDELRAVKFRYDTAQTGTVDTPQQESQNAPILLTSAPRYRWYR